MEPTASPRSVETTQAAPRAGSPLASALWESTKPGITRLVTITSGVGFVLASLNRPWTAGSLVGTALACLVGTALSAAGANALNQWLEHPRDARMPRTHARPIPSGRASPRDVAATGLLASVLGIGTLWLGVGLVPALASLVTVLLYVGVYTPMKPVSAAATLVGAIPGALPPVIGWTSGASPNDLAGLLHPGAISLFVLMFVWQVPHFLAIAWIYRDDYAKGGFRMLPLLDEAGTITVRTILAWSLLLVPAALWPAWAMEGDVGWPYVALAGAMGTAFVALSWRLVRTRARADARRVFFASIIHLPLLLAALVGESLTRALLA